MTRLLITGATGLVGLSTVEAALTQGYEVHGVSRRPPPADWPTTARHHLADLSDAEQQRSLIGAVRPTHLLHAAWDATPGAFWSAPSNLDWVAASLMLLRQFADSGGTRVVMVGSCAEYDWTAPSPLNERTTALRPHTLYGQAKLSLFSLAQVFCRQIGLSFACGRIFLIYGHRESPKRFVASIIRNLLAGRPADCSPGTQWRDLSHVDDVGAGLVALLASTVIGPVNVASGQRTQLKDVATRIATLIDRKDLLRLGALPLQPGEPAELIADTQRLMTEVGFVPRISLDDGLRSTIQGISTHAC